MEQFAQLLILAVSDHAAKEMKEVLYQHQLVSKLVHLIASCHDEDIQLFSHHDQEARNGL